MSFAELLNICASVQFAALWQLERNLKQVLDYTKRKPLPLNCIQLAGGCARNALLQEMVTRRAAHYKLPVVVPRADLCGANAASVAWMGHELRNVDQDVDLRTISAIPSVKVPLGSYMSDLISFDHVEQKVAPVQATPSQLK